MSAAPRARLADRRADDVDLAAAADGTMWAAWSTAELHAEIVKVARLQDEGFDDPIVLAPGRERVFRPRLCPLPAGVLALASAWNGGGCRPVGLIARATGERLRFELPAGGDVYQLAAAPTGDRALVAWEERRGAHSRIRAGRLDETGRLEEQSLPPPADGAWRSPALCVTVRGAPWLACVAGGPRAAGRVLVARLADPAGRDFRAVDAGPAPQEAPALAALPDGRLAVAWHAPLSNDGAGVLRWLRVAILDGDTFVDVSPAPPPAIAREAAGWDQGWEYPALCAARGGTLWLAGRSSHGHHVAARHPSGAWSARRSVSEPGWGGRGRTLALLPIAGAAAEEALLLRREPEGLELSSLEVAGAEETATTPAPAARAPAAVARRTSRPPARRDVLFGDLHQHTAHSDGAGSLEEVWLRAREARALDFAAVTDHDRFCQRAIGPATWAYMGQVADAFDEPGRFAAFAAYEFTGPRHPGPGHKCVLFGDRRPARLPDKDVAAVLAAVRAHGGIAVPHHVGWTGADMTHHDPTLQPVWEICSVHGCYERLGAPTAFPARGDPDLPGQFIRDALDAGLRFGLVGSTDSHGLLYHHGISPKRDPFTTGLCAVLAAEPQREAILAALRARRAYATTGARIHLRVELDGALMGSELPQGTRGRLAIEVAGTAALARVTVVRPGGDTPVPLSAAPPGTPFQASVPIEPAPGGPVDYLYVVAAQEDGETAWSSPIWIG